MAVYLTLLGKPSREELVQKLRKKVAFAKTTGRHLSRNTSNRVKVGNATIKAYCFTGEEDYNYTRARENIIKNYNELSQDDSFDYESFWPHIDLHE